MAGHRGYVQWKSFMEVVLMKPPTCFLPCQFEGFCDGCGISTPSSIIV